MTKIGEMFEVLSNYEAAAARLQAEREERDANASRGNILDAEIEVELAADEFAVIFAPLVRLALEAARTIRSQVGNGTTTEGEQQ